MSVVSRIAAAARRNRNVLAFAIGVLVVLALGQSRASILDTGINILIFSLIGVPLALMYGHGGVISMCQAAFAAVGGYVTAILTVNHGWSPYVTLALAMLVPGMVAFLIARPILRLPEMALALTTLALGQAWAITAGLAEGLTGGHVGMYGVPALPFADDRAGAFLGIAVLVGLAIAGFDNFVRSARGRALNAIRVDPILAGSTGIDVARHRAVIFGVAAGAAGLAGWYYAHYVGFLSPVSLSFHQSAAVLFMVVIGGRRSSIGAVLGASVYVLASDVLPGGTAQGAWFGAMLVLVLLLAPDGLASVGRLRRGRPASRPQPAAAPAEGAAPVGEAVRGVA